MVFHWSLSDSKSPRISRNLLSILANLNNDVVWMVSTGLLTSSKSSSSFNNLFVTVRKAPITIGIIATFLFHSFFQFLSKIEILILLFTFFQFYSLVSQYSLCHHITDICYFVESYLFSQGLNWFLWHCFVL